jgi:hypothetical protein
VLSEHRACPRCTGHPPSLSADCVSLMYKHGLGDVLAARVHLETAGLLGSVTQAAGSWQNLEIWPGLWVGNFLTMVYPKLSHGVSLAFKLTHPSLTSPSSVFVP